MAMFWGAFLGAIAGWLFLGVILEIGGGRNGK